MRTIPLVIASLLLAACSDAPTAVNPPSAPNAGSQVVTEDAAMNASADAQVAQLRRLLAPYHTLAQATAAGWDTDITGCLELPGVGGMGHHYANLDYFSDGQITWDEPELLIFAPSPNARDGLRLVAVEYIVFKSEMPAAPTLYGQTFHSNDDVDAWALHVWFGAHNPDGMFADWNPTISCS
jgi:hypothetical protein